MKAVVHDNYGGPEVLHLADIEQPRPKDHEVLVRVIATTVNRTDCGMRSAKPFIVRYFSGWRRPKRKVLGTEFAGVVAEVGSAVTQFAVDDEVFGVNVEEMGAHAEFVCVEETAPIALKPSNMTFNEAGAVCDGVILALTCLRRADPQPGQHLLVYGASGSIGTAGVQLAKQHFGVHVTAVCDTKNIDTVRSLGADEVIDYTVDDFTKNGKTYAIIFDSWLAGR
jgi:NADPH:quinone reductase-like Zn-dependent oxidoreductase